MTRCSGSICISILYSIRIQYIRTYVAQLAAGPGVSRDTVRCHMVSIQIRDKADSSPTHTASIVTVPDICAYHIECIMTVPER